MTEEEEEGREKEVHCRDDRERRKGKVSDESGQTGLITSFENMIKKVESGYNSASTRKPLRRKNVRMMMQKT